MDTEVTQQEKGVFRLWHSLMNTEASRISRERNISLKEAYKEAWGPVSKAVGMEEQDFHDAFSRAFAATVSSRSPRGPRGTRKKQLPSTLPEVVVISKEEYDPFRDDDIVEELSTLWKCLKPGQTGKQEYPQAGQAEHARELLPRVTSKNQWQSYKSTVEGKVLFVKRVK